MIYPLLYWVEGQRSLSHCEYLWKVVTGSSTREMQYCESCLLVLNVVIEKTHIWQMKVLLNHGKKARRVLSRHWFSSFATREIHFNNSSFLLPKHIPTCILILLYSEWSIDKVRFSRGEWMWFVVTGPTTSLGVEGHLECLESDTSTTLSLLDRLAIRVTMFRLNVLNNTRTSQGVMSLSRYSWIL